MKRLILIISASICWLGCGNGISDQKANIRIVNAVPDIDAVDVFIDESLDFPGLEYLGSTGYFEVTEGSRSLRINEANSFTSLISRELSINGDIDYTVLVTDNAINAKEVVARDDNDPPESGRVKLRFIHVAPKLKSVDVYISDPSTGIESLTPSIEDVSFKEVSKYLQSLEGTYRIRITLSNKKEIVADSGSVALGADQIRSVLIAAAPNGAAPYKIILLNDRN